MYKSVFISLIVRNTSWKIHAMHMQCNDLLTIANICKFIEKCN